MSLRLSVCIEMIFRDLPLAERLARVADAGYGAYEFWDWRSKDLDELEAAQRRHGLALAGLLGSGGGALVDPARRDGFLEGLRGACAVARRLGAPTLIITVGQALPGVERSRQHESIVAGLRAAAPIAEGEGLALAVEPLNTRIDHAGYYLDSTAEGLAIVEEVGSPAVGLLYDIYHMQAMEGNLSRTLEAHLAAFVHLHVADLPGRHEPGSGEINYRTLFRLLARLGYGGYVGLEYRPLADAAVSLAAVRALAEAATPDA